MNMNILRVISFVVCSILSISLIAQEIETYPVDYASISTEIQDASSTLYYPKLIAKYEAGSSELSIEEKRHIYYGYTHQSGYNPFERSNYLDSVITISNAGSWTNADFENLNRLTSKILDANPMDIFALSNKLAATQKLGLQNEYDITYNQIMTLLDAIMSSGNGMSLDTPYVVISNSDEFEMIRVLGFQYGGEHQLIENIDYLNLIENQFDYKGLFFDNRAATDHLLKSSSAN